MLRRSVSILAVLLYGVLAFPGKARADTALTQAVVEAIRNQVQILVQSESARSAQISDVLVPGDGLTTANDSLAELRFNDGSLGRLGEQVVFWFTPGTRNFSLSNGTVLLLIPPGQGRTTIQTPNASAGIQGSALFVRYVEETDTTVVGALTDSNIQVVNEDGTQQYTLAAGEMAVAVGDRITNVYEFDLQTFYETSSLARDLAPDRARDGAASPESRDSDPSANGQTSDRSSDPAIAAVQDEMDTALQRQEPITAEGSIETPDFLRMRDSSSTDRADPASDPLAPRNNVTDPTRADDSGSPTQDRTTSGSPVNDPRPLSVGDPQGRDFNEIPAGRGPRDNPGLGPENNPGLGPDRNPGLGPEGNPGLGPEGNPGLGPEGGDKPGREPGDNGGQGPGDSPGRGPEDRPDRGSSGNPGEGPDRNPGRDPGNNSGQGGDDGPGRGPNNNPGRGPDDNPGRGPDDNPGRGPDDNPGRGPDDNPGLGPNDNPGLGPNDNPGRGPDDNPGRDRGVDVDIDLPGGVDVDVEVGR